MTGEVRNGRPGPISARNPTDLEPEPDRSRRREGGGGRETGGSPVGSAGLDRLDRLIHLVGAEQPDVHLLDDAIGVDEEVRGHAHDPV